MIHNTIVCAPDGLRDQLRSLTRMQLVRKLASWRPDLSLNRLSLVRAILLIGGLAPMPPWGRCQL